MFYLSVFYFLIGIFLFILLYNYNGMINKAVLISAIFDSGLMIYGYAIVGEFFMGCILIAYICKKFKNSKNIGCHKILDGVSWNLIRKEFAISKLVNRIKIQYQKLIFLLKKRSASQKLFLVFLFYMIGESFYGIYTTGDIRVIRFVLLFSLILIILIVDSFHNKSIDLFFSYYICMLYFGIYFLCGLLGDFIIKSWMGRFFLQGLIWTGTTVAFFPIVIFFPTIFMFLSNRKTVLWGMVGYIFMIICGLYYDSRMCMIALFVFTVIFLCLDFSIYRGKMFILLLIIFFGCYYYLKPVFIPSVQAGASTPVKVLKGMYYTVIGVLGLKETSDRGRILDIESSLLASCSSIRSFLVGQGVWSHRLVLGNFYKILVKKDRYNEKKLKRCATFPALLADIGWIGVSLMLLCIILSYKAIFLDIKNFEVKFYIFLSINLILLSNFISINYDDILLYLIIFPRGLLFGYAKALDCFVSRSCPICPIAKKLHLRQ